MGQQADGPDERHRRPAGVSDETVAALGKLSEALECVERARGHLYSLHQLIGHADLMLDDAVEQFRAAGHRGSPTGSTPSCGPQRDRRRWTFQIVEDFDDGYHALFRELDRQARDELVGGGAPVRGGDEGAPPHPGPAGPRGPAGREG